MIDNIIDNLIYINDDEKNELKLLLNNNTNTYEYLNNKYFEIMKEWNKKYDCFDIPSCIITISIDGKNNYYCFGKNTYDENTIFDIASISKLYTEFMLFNIIEDYKISLDTKISSITNLYKNISNMSFKDLISFNHTYLTKVDIRNCNCYEDGLKALRTIYLDKELEGKYLYTDLPIMVLTDLLCLYTNKSYKELFDEYIIKKYNLNDTYLQIDSDRYISLNKNYVNDPKANIMGGYYGHAGVKTTSKDFMKFFNNCLVNNKYLDLFLTHNNTYKKDGTKANGVALIGNINLPLKKGFSLSSRYLTKCGFMVQGSTRCHAETCKFIIDNNEHIVSMSLFIDLYTQYDNIKKYEEKTNQTFTKEYYVNNNKLVMSDVRKLLNYRDEPSIFRMLINEISKSKIIDLYSHLKKI